MAGDRMLGMRRLTTACCTLAVLTLGAGCTTLGPMPVVSGQSLVPDSRPHVEGQLGAIPGYYLSSAVETEPAGTASSQLAVMFDPNDLIGVQGLGLGGRVVSGGDGDPYGEPMLRYRTTLDDGESLAVGGVLNGTFVKDSAEGASLEALRLGGEVGADWRVTPMSKYLELHLQGGLALLGLDVSGSYCMAADGYGVSCDGAPANAHASASGVYPTLFGGLSLEGGRHLESAFHGARLAFIAATGKMPRVVAAEQEDAVNYFSMGLTLSLMFGGI